MTQNEVQCFSYIRLVSLSPTPHPHMATFLKHSDFEISGRFHSYQTMW